MIHIRLQPGRFAEVVIVLALATNLIGFAAWVTHVVSCFEPLNGRSSLQAPSHFPSRSCTALVSGSGLGDDDEPTSRRVALSPYPALFARRHESAEVTPMGRGFTCDDGWFDLIDELARKLQAAADSGRIAQPIAEQVKEKFGELRFYLSEMTPGARELIDEAGERSAVTCEVCGAPGVLRRQRGVQTLCDLHAAVASTIVKPQPKQP